MIQPIQLNTNTNEDNVNLSELIKQSFVNVDEVIERQPVAFSIGKHSYKGKYYDTPVASFGDFFCLIGASKSRKTFASKAVIASMLGRNKLMPSFRGYLNGKAVVHIDTEQSLFHTQRGARQILEIVGSNDVPYYPYSFRSLDHKQRVEVIDQIIKEIDNIGVIFIDGIADLVGNVNDLDECNAVVQKLMSWSKDNNICIGTILHMNYGSQKATGHMGSAVTKKAESVIAVNTEEGITTLTPQYTRNIMFNEVRFEINDDHLPKQIIDTNDDIPF